MFKVKYENINKEILYKYNHQEIIVDLNNENFYIKLELKINSEQIVAFSNGAVNREKKDPPIFMRSTWAEEIYASCVYIDDKTIHGDTVRIGWGIGRKDRHFINDYSMIIKKIASQLEIRPRNVIYFGSSAGGFMSLMLACKHKYTTAIVNNPQTNVFNFHPGHVKELCDYVFPDLSHIEIKELYKDRFSIIEFFLKEDYIPRIFYYQNNKYEVDMEKHFKPFIKGLEVNELPDRKVMYCLYNNKKLGHDPLPKEITIANINHILATIDLKY